MVGSTEMYRAEEFQLEQASFGGDIRIQNTRGRILTMNGLFSQATVRNDASYNRGQWDLKDAYKYFSEAWGGYHWDVGHGLNVDAGIFVSYVGLFSYYNFDNWAYQPSYVSSNTPWFFNGLRIQYFVTDKLKIEPWIINGWQSYGRYNGHGGLGGQIMWRPNPKFDFNFNDYGLGEDDAGFPGRSRVHADYSGQWKIWDNPKAKGFDKLAMTITGDAGCEYGGGPASYAVTGQTSRSSSGASPMMGTQSTYNGGVNCHSSANGKPKQMFIGWMAYMRGWWDHDRHAITLGGGQMNNPGRYLTLLPAINGATATTGTPYFTENAGDSAQAHDMTFTYDYMPSQFITFRLEEAYRYSAVPYWSGRRGVTPPGGNNGNPADYQCAAGGDSGYGYVYTNSNTGVGVPGLPLAIANCQMQNLSNGFITPGDTRALWWPDLRTNQTTTLGSIMVRF
jgi:acyl-CoA-binding protein